MMLPRESLVLSFKTVEHRSRKSRDLLQTDEFMVTHPLFVVTAFSVNACVLLHAHPPLRTAQGGIFLFDAVSDKHFILARSVFVLHGHRLCRDLAVVLIASIAIWILDILLHFFYRETGNWRFIGSETRVYRIIGSGATVQSVSRCLRYFFIPRWNEEAATLV